MKELADHLASDFDNRNFGVYDTSDDALRTIYYGEWGDDTAEGLLVVSSPSPPPHQYIDTEYTVVDIFGISPHTDRAINLLRQVYNAYDRAYGYTLGDWYVYNSHALGTIIDTGRTRENSKEFKLSVQFRCRNLYNVS